jgi:hypothetical protein
MGGGGAYGGGPSNEDLERLEEIAKKALREPEQSGRRSVFISFVNEDLAEVNLLRGQAKNENAPFEFNDWSLREPFESKRTDYIKRGIRERIRQSSTTLVYLSERTAGSKWVDWEIRESVALGKRVVAMYSGAKPLRLPAAVSEFGIVVIPWTHDAIARALE